MKQFLKDGLVWGFILWLIGYVLGIALFAVVPANMIGWVISPIGTIIAVWVLIKKVKGTALPYYMSTGLVWVVLAIIFDYIFIVRLFNSVEYYKLDVYVYYIITFVLPIIVGYYKTRKIS